ncbi:MAG: putative zinc-binding protein [Promethearchaeati archaeon SRVP18_Atabeyarchaeia-1]
MSEHGDWMRNKVGVVTCSGEEISEGMVSRVAARKVLEELEPNDTMTICIPLYLAGGEEERSFVTKSPTVTIDGCDKLCAKRSVEKVGGRPIAAVVVTDFMKREHVKLKTESRRELEPKGAELANTIASKVAAIIEDYVKAQGRVTGRREG